MNAEALKHLATAAGAPTKPAKPPFWSLEEDISPAHRDIMAGYAASALHDLQTVEGLGRASVPGSADDAQLQRLTRQVDALSKKLSAFGALSHQLVTTVMSQGTPHSPTTSGLAGTNASEPQWQALLRNIQDSPPPRPPSPPSPSPPPPPLSVVSLLASLSKRRTLDRAARLCTDVALRGGMATDAAGAAAYCSRLLEGEREALGRAVQADADALDTQLPRRVCSLVSSSAASFGQAWGGAIDAAEVVVRMGSATVRGHERLVGRRTSVRHLFCFARPCALSGGEWGGLAKLGEEEPGVTLLGLTNLSKAEVAADLPRWRQLSPRRGSAALLSIDDGPAGEGGGLLDEAAYCLGQAAPHAAPLPPHLVSLHLLLVRTGCSAVTLFGFSNASLAPVASLISVAGGYAGGSAPAGGHADSAQMPPAATQPLPVSPPPQHTAQVIVPALGSDRRLIIRTAGGRRLIVEVPPGVQPGQTLQVVSSGR